MDCEVLVITQAMKDSDLRIFECQALRRVVFQQEQGIAAELDCDGEDFGKDTFHLLLFDCIDDIKTPVATVRGRPIEEPKGIKLERMCVLDQFRDAGLGSLLLHDFEVHAREIGVANVWLHAQIRSVEFYRKHGYRSTGELFLEAGINHYLMTKALS